VSETEIEPVILMSPHRADESPPIADADSGPT